MPSTSTVSPHDPPGHPANVVHAGRDEPEVGPAVVQVVAQRLALGDRDVGTELAGRRQHAERERIEHLDRARARVVCRARTRSRTGSRTPYTLGCCTTTAATSDRLGAPPRSPSGEGLGLVARAPAGRRAAFHERAESTPPDTSTRIASRAPGPCAPPRPGRWPRRRARRWTRPCRSARRPSTGTRTAPAARPATAPAGRACTRCRTPSGPPAPRRRGARSGRTRRRPRSTRAGRRCGRWRPASRMSATSSISETPAGMSSARSRRTAAGSWSKSSATRGPAERREHLADLVVGVGSEPHERKCTDGDRYDGVGCAVRGRRPDASSRPYFVTSDR